MMVKQEDMKICIPKMTTALLYLKNNSSFSKMPRCSIFSNAQMTFSNYLTKLYFSAFLCCFIFQKQSHTVILLFKQIK